MASNRAIRCSWCALAVLTFGGLLGASEAPAQTLTETNTVTTHCPDPSMCRSHELQHVTTNDNVALLHDSGRSHATGFLQEGNEVQSVDTSGADMNRAMLQSTTTAAGDALVFHSHFVVVATPSGGVQGNDNSFVR